MRSRALLIAVVTGVLLLAGTGGVLAYDQSRASELGKGVRIGGVDVSGLTVEQARAKLRRTVLEPLNRPVVVKAIGKRFTLPPTRSQVDVDVDGSVQAAMDRSRDGNVLVRTWRGVTGKSLGAEVPLEVTYSEKAIDRLVERVAGKVDKPAVDAKLDLESGDVTPRKAEEGRRVRAARLRREVERRLVEIATDKPVRARIRTLKPKVTTEELAKKYPAVLIVDRAAFKLTLYKDLEKVKTYGIAVGQVGLETPAGLYSIQNKAVNPAWSVPNSAWAGDLAGTVVPGGIPENPLKARWLGIYNGAGIHGTGDPGSIGTAASHGCVRMTIPDVIELYDQVPVGAPVYIA